MVIVHGNNKMRLLSLSHAIIIIIVLPENENSTTNSNKIPTQYSH